MTEGGRERVDGGDARVEGGSARVERLGDRAVRFARPAVPARALVRDIRTWPGVVDVVIARDDIGVYFAGAPILDPARIAALASLPDLSDPPREHELRAVYDGEDLLAVASTLAVTPAEVISLHASRTYTVEVMGFLPGFAYLTGLDPRLASLPRRATPRTRVPAGSIGIAGGYTGVYPFDSPGGWHLLGRVLETRMFSNDGALLALGDRVRFIPA